MLKCRKNHLIKLLYFLINSIWLIKTRLSCKLLFILISCEVRESDFFYSPIDLEICIYSFD